MGRDDESLLDDASVERWIRKNDPGGFDKLQLEMASGRISGARAVFCGHFLRRMTGMESAFRLAVDQDLARRSTEAAEKSAQEAERSRRVAYLALFVALAALAVSAWPLIRPA